MTWSVETTMRELLACLCTALGEAGWEGMCCVEPGVPAFDECCDSGGQAWVRLVTIYPAERYPTRGAPADPKKCAQQWAALVEFGAVTCVCMEGCTCEIKSADAHRVLQMTQAGVKAAACCGIDDLRVVDFTGVGPQGGCAGFSAQVIIPTTVCC